MASASESDGQPIGTFWALRLEGPLPDGVTPRLVARFERLELKSARTLSRAMGLVTTMEVLKRLVVEKRCYVAWVDGKLAAYGWVTFDEEHIGELGVRFCLTPGEAYIWDCATLPAYRGQRLYPALLTFILRELQAEGLRLAWIGADTENIASQKGFRLAGFQPVADAMMASTGALQVRERPDGPRELTQSIHTHILPDTDRLPGGDGMAEIIGPHRGQPMLAAGAPLASAQAAMVMAHGRGASAEDILTLAVELNQPNFAYLAPQASGYQWYPNRFMEPTASNEPWLSSAFSFLAFALAQVAEAGIPAERTMLLGFSQGACLLLEYTARNAQRYGGIVGLSGGLIGPDGTPRDYPGSLAGTPAFLGCSDVDPHIPKARVELTAEVLQRLGGTVEMRLYRGMGHMANEDELTFVRRMMTNLLGA